MGQAYRMITQTQPDGTAFARQMLLAMKLSFPNLGSGEA
jgi:hypothetical protein